MKILTRIISIVTVLMLMVVYTALLSPCVCDADHYVADGVDVVGQKMFKDFSLGLRPSIGYQLNRHWQIGVEGYIGLTNIYKEYGHSAGSEHLHCVVATVGYVF